MNAAQVPENHQNAHHRIEEDIHIDLIDLLKICSRQYVVGGEPQATLAQLFNSTTRSASNKSVLRRCIVTVADTLRIICGIEPVNRVGSSIDQDGLAEFCRRNHIPKISLFGSVLRDDFGPDSDVNMLIEFEPGHVPGLRFFELEEELSKLLGRKVDLNTPNFLSSRFRSQALAEARVQYVAS